MLHDTEVQYITVYMFIMQIVNSIKIIVHIIITQMHKIFTYLLDPDNSYVTLPNSPSSPSPA